MYKEKRNDSDERECVQLGLKLELQCEKVEKFKSRYTQDKYVY